MQVLGSPNGLGDFVSNLEAGITTDITPEAQAIIVPIIAPYAIALVILSAAGLMFGVSAYSKVKRLERSMKRSSAPGAAP